MIKVKICGVTCVEDATAAVAAGTDALGVVCHAPVPRCVDLERAAGIFASLPPFVTPVMLFVNAPKESVLEFIAAVPHALLQFHGDEDASYCASFKRPYIKACQPQTQDDVAAMAAAHPDAMALVCDGGGGAGRTFDWSFLPAPNQRKKPLVLAGGLTAENVAQAIEATKPDAVDTSSGVCVDGDPLRKDNAKLAAFIGAARRADMKHAS